MTYLKKYISSLSGKEKIYLKSNIDYNKTHFKHRGRCLYKITEA